MVAINRYNINNFSNINNFTKSDAAPISRKVPVSFTEGKKNEEPKKTFTESLTNKEFLSEIEGLPEDQKGKLISEINNNKESLNKKFGEFIRGEVKFSDIVELLEEIGVKVFDEIQEFDDVNIPRNSFVYESINLITNNILSENTKLSDDLLEFLPSDLKIDKNDSKIKGISDEIDNKFNQLVAQLGKDDKANNELPGKLTDLIPELERFANLVGVKNKNSFMQQALFRIVDKYHNKEVSTIYKKFMKATLDEAKSDRNENYAPVYFSQTIKNYYGDYTGDLHQTFKTNVANFYKGTEGISFLMDAYKKTNQRFGVQQFGFEPISALSPSDKEILEMQQQFAQSRNIKNEAFQPESNATDLFKIREGIYKSTLDTSSLKHGVPSQYNVGSSIKVGTIPLDQSKEAKVKAHQDLVDLIKTMGGISYKDGTLVVSSSFMKDDYNKLLKKAEELGDKAFSAELIKLYDKTHPMKTSLGFGLDVAGEHLLTSGLFSWSGNFNSDLPLGVSDPANLTQFDALLRAGFSLPTSWGLFDFFGQFDVQSRLNKMYRTENKTTKDVSSSSEVKKEDPTTKTENQQETTSSQEIDITTNIESVDAANNYRDKIVFLIGTMSKPIPAGYKVKLVVGEKEVGTYEGSGRYQLDDNQFKSIVGTGDTNVTVKMVVARTTPKETKTVKEEPIKTVGDPEPLEEQVVNTTEKNGNVEVAKEVVTHPSIVKTVTKTNITQTEHLLVSDGGENEALLATYNVSVSKTKDDAGEIIHSFKIDSSRNSKITDVTKTTTWTEVVTEIDTTKKINTTTTTTVHKVEEFRTWSSVWNFIAGVNYYKNFIFKPADSVTLSVPVALNLGLGIGGFKVTNGSLEHFSSQAMKNRFSWDAAARIGLDVAWKNGFFLNTEVVSRSITSYPKPDLTTALALGYIDPQSFWGIKIGTKNSYNFNSSVNHFALNAEADIYPKDFLRFKIFSGVSLLGKNFESFNLGGEVGINKNWTLSVKGVVDNLFSEKKGNQISGKAVIGVNYSF